MNKYVQWLLVGFIAFVFIQSLFFKFSGSEETVIIFNTIGDWMGTIGIPQGLSQGFAAHGGYLVGGTELIAAGLLIASVTRLIGAILSLGVISGAIFFHLFTPLGVDRVVDAAGNTDGGQLFYMACAVWICSLTLIWLNRPSGLR